MPDPNKDPVPEQKPASDAPAKPTGDPPLTFRTPLFGGTLSGSGRELSPGLYQGNADYLFRSGDLLGAQLKLRTDPAFAIDEYGLNGRFGLGNGNQFKFDASASPTAGSYRLGGNLLFGENTYLNADWSRTALGQVYGADGAFKLGRDGNGTAQFRVDEPNGTTKIDTQLKFNEDFKLNADWSRTALGQVYGADGAFKLGRDGNGSAQFRVDEPNGTTKIDTQLKFNEDFRLNADWSRTALGQVYGADGAFKLGRDGNGTAQFRVDEPNGTTKIDTQLKFNEDFRLNADWSRTALGQVYGADGAFKLGRDGNGTAQFRVDEPNGTSVFNTRLKFDNDFSLNGDYTSTRAGAIYGADGLFKLGKDGSGTAAFRVDEPAGTSMFNTKLKFGEGFGLNADYTNTKNGAIYGAESTFKLGKDGSGTGGFRVDEPANTAALNSKLLFGNGNTLNFDLSRTPGGSVYGADGSFGIGRDGKGLASFRIDEPGGTSNYKLGASFANGNAFNAQLMADRLGTSFGFDAKLGFDKGAGSLALDGKFGPKATELGAAINYRNKDLEYSGVVRANDASGAFRLSEFGAKVSTTGNERYKFTAEAGYRPDTREAYGMVGLTISFGGGSKPSRPIARIAEPAFDSGRQDSDVVANFREKQGILLRPENRTLYEQAVAGVQKLNGEGAKLPVTETAASLTVLAKQNGMDRIGYVALGNPTSSGQQNLFIGDGEPSNPSGKKAFVDRAQAATTPMDDSLRKLAGDAAQPGQPNPLTADPQALPTARRGTM